MYAQRAKNLGMSVEAHEAQILSLTPLRKYAKHEEIANAARFSPRATRAHDRRVAQRLGRAADELRFSWHGISDRSILSIGPRRRAGSRPWHISVRSCLRGGNFYSHSLTREAETDERSERGEALLKRIFNIYTARLF